MSLPPLDVNKMIQFLRMRTESVPPKEPGNLPQRGQKTEPVSGSSNPPNSSEIKAKLRKITAPQNRKFATPQNINVSHNPDGTISTILLKKGGSTFALGDKSFPSGAEVTISYASEKVHGYWVLFTKGGVFQGKTYEPGNDVFFGDQWNELVVNKPNNTIASDNANVIARAQIGR